MSEIERFRNQFYSGSHDYIARTGDSPKICIAGTVDYATFEFLASELCTITDMRLTTNDEKEITYCGIMIFKGADKSGLIFGR